MQTLKGKRLVEVGDTLESSVAPGDLGKVIGLEYVGESADPILTVKWDEKRTTRVVYHGVGGTGRVLWSELPLPYVPEVEIPPRHDWRW